MALFPSHQFGKVRDRSDRTAEKKSKEIHTTPRLVEIPASRTARGPGGPVTQQGGGRTHHTSTVRQPTRTHMRHTLPELHTVHQITTPFWLTRTNANAHQRSPSNRISTEGKTPPTPGRPEGGPRYANDRPAGDSCCQIAPAREGEAGKSKNTTTTMKEEARPGPRKKPIPRSV